MFEISGLSKRDIQEEYEDLVFRKVMAIYVENESKQILAEIKAEKENNNVPVDTREIEKLYDKKERRENLSILWRYSKKVVSFAAMIVFVAIISLSSAVVAFADVRESIAEYLYYYLTYAEKGTHTEVSIGEKFGFIDEEHYNWDGAFAPTYMTEGFMLTDENVGADIKSHTYTYQNEFIYIEQNTEKTGSHIDTEDAQIIKEIVIGNSQGLFVEKGGLTYITWSCGDTLLFVCGTTDSTEIIKISEGLKIVK